MSHATTSFGGRSRKGTNGTMGANTQGATTVEQQDIEPELQDEWWMELGEICSYDARGNVSRLSQRAIQQEAVEIIAGREHGIRFMELVREIHDRHPDTPFGSIPGALNPLGRTVLTDKVAKPERGLFMPAGDDLREGPVPPFREREIYRPLADFLLGDAEDLTAAVPLDDARLGGKWGTPDVLGVYRPLSDDVLSWSPEILAVEVKNTVSDVVVAFGQAIAYQLFANKSYLALPSSISPVDRRELVARCKLHGLGLILFNAPDEFTVVVPARRRAPDIESARQFVERLRARAEDEFRALFG